MTFASSAPSSATRTIASDFGTSNEVAILTTSLFLVGYVIGELSFKTRSHTLLTTVICVIQGLSSGYAIMTAAGPTGERR